MDISSAAAATQILSKAMSALNAVRERAKGSQDTDLKAHISTLYDELLNLKELVVRLTEENGELRRQLVKPPSEKHAPELRQVGAVNYYFDGEKGPCCQKCYDSKGTLTVLTPAENRNGGIRRQCLLCNATYYEKPMDIYGVRRGGGGSPWS